ncbi:MAG: alpha-amylase, partial [Myxococcota bacterium]
WRSGFDTAHPTYRWIQQLSDVRRRHLALRRGEQRIVYATERNGDEPDAGMIAYERTGGDAGSDYALVVMNTNRDHESETAFEGQPMVVSAAPGTRLVDAMSGAEVTVQADGLLSVRLAPLTVAILVAEP